MASLIARIGYIFRDPATAVPRLPKLLLSAPVVNCLGGLVARHYQSFSTGTTASRRLKVLILRNQYMWDQNLPSNEIYILDNTLKASGLADHDVLTYDSDLGISPYSDLQLIRRCSEMRPDLVVLSSWWKNPTHPSVAGLRYVRERLGIPVAAIWWDTCTKEFWPAILPWIDDLDIHVIAENPNGYGLDMSHPSSGRIHLVWPPEDPGLFYCGDEKKDILVSFIGQVGNYRDYRKKYLDLLISEGIEGYFSASDGNKATHEEYAQVIRRSLMSINFSFSADTHQLKGRVIQSLLSGAMLLESENNQTSLFFRPGKDFVPYSSPKDLLEKIRYYQRNRNELNAVAQNGRLRAAQFYTGALFWESLLQKAGLITSKALKEQEYVIP